MNVIDKTWISISLAAGVVLADTLPVLAGDTGGTIGGGLDVKGILDEATTTPTGTAAGAPFIEKVKAFGATAAICTFIIAIIGILIALMGRGLLFGFSNENTRNVSKGNVIAAICGALIIGSAIAIIVFVSGVGNNLFG